MRAAAYKVPTDLPEADGTLAWDATTAVVVHVEAEQVAGTGWSYAPAAAATPWTSRERAAVEHGF
ncbi:hypothetical protein AB0J35_48045 [Nonomuraea angiospora]|uniref:hypothetical protein n=1 Tax=Nonomuraea angiospora TaxID=46172 RepID=UPI003421F7F5